MHRLLILPLVMLLLTGTTTLHAADEAKPLPGNLKPLKDYKHEPLQGIDSVVGKVVRKDGFTIQYEIGPIPKPGLPRFGGSFTDYAAAMRPEERAWYKEQPTPSGMVHIAQSKAGLLIVSLPDVGANLTATPKTPEDTVEVILTGLSMSLKKP